jgi:hypothetical protein
MRNRKTPFAGRTRSMPSVELSVCAPPLEKCSRLAIQVLSETAANGWRRVAHNCLSLAIVRRRPEGGEYKNSQIGNLSQFSLQSPCILPARFATLYTVGAKTPNAPYPCWRQIPSACISWFFANGERRRALAFF